MIVSNIDPKWELGDWWNEGHRYGDPRSVVKSDVWEGPSLNSCITAGVVAEQFPNSRRRHSLKWGHHVELLSLSEETQDFFLLESEVGGYSIKALRKRVEEFQSNLEGV